MQFCWFEISFQRSRRGCCRKYSMLTAALRWLCQLSRKSTFESLRIAPFSLCSNSRNPTKTRNSPHFLRSCGFIARFLFPQVGFYLKFLYDNRSAPLPLSALALRTKFGLRTLALQVCCVLILLGHPQYKVCCKQACANLVFRMAFIIKKSHWWQWDQDLCGE